MIRITRTEWYRESVRISGLTGQRFALNAVVSLLLLAALATFALAAN
jgi:hypothetical protein